MGHAQTCCRDEEFQASQISGSEVAAVEANSPVRNSVFADVDDLHIVNEDVAISEAATDRPLESPRVLELTFQKADGNVVTITLSKRPLGFTFVTTNEAPIVVFCVETGSQAQELGIKAGMVLTGIDGKSVENWNPTSTIPKKFRLLKAKASMLPSQQSYPDHAAVGA
eukprot:gnl/TRDRNA2_/TRDRNA2_177765_c3_seq5.p1 gnl/TRDRNA2_/TRDRNA2_177765_c3~~gnl/TRDRNA2_/TRDRNA2_177765_c3_seq5.p1  ORF type:complete len:168 (+),score=26.51 gnl/TRDRNA2_/TRDRNA2_177765_c3_seq5:55-558(+)